MRRVRVVGPAAVRAELLDRLLARDRAARDRLLRALDGRRVGEAGEVLDDALADEDERDDDRTGSSTRVVTRVMSTQKFPMVSERRRVNPRMRATATATPTAADTKFWTASPDICVRWLIVDSPP